ncbi:neuraminidase-like domain-containing protein [Enterobacter cloacae]|uniref:Tc toxin subunit A-related protein n=1 Tax=Enterobacter cloacae TaxID=550 RepID=UPI0021D3CF6B|nr:neuraminidase-like domain-containing protein [Enterobacter cloacae]MCU6209262.1 hypothetical protein [Enterobacter cloacae]
MARIQNTRLNEITSLAGVNSPASAALLTPAEFIRRLDGQVPAHEAYEALEAARKKRDELLVLEKSIVTRASPLLPAAIRVGLRHPDISLQEYEEWFGGRATRYASPGDVSSVFSPAAYLTEMYREARELYPEGSRWHIDTRRPDLANLILSQENMDGEVAALTLSNEILMESVRAEMEQDGNKPGDDELLQALSAHLTSSDTPYHYHHARLRQVCLQKDPDYRQMLAAPQVLGHLSGSTLAGVYYDISPALSQLLTESIPADEAGLKAMFEKYFGENVRASDLLHPQALRRWYGLTDDEINSFLYGLRHGEYVDDILTILVDNKIHRIKITSSDELARHFSYLRFTPQGGSKWKVAVKFAAMGYMHHLFRIDKFNTYVSGVKFDSKNVGDEMFVVGKEYSFSFTYANTENLPSKFNVQSFRYQTGGGGYIYTHDVDMQVLEPSAYLLKLNKAIRLYKATGLSPRVLEDIVNSVNPNQITDETLALLFRTALLMKHYNMSHEEALVMTGVNISIFGQEGDPSQFDRLFNSPPLIEGGFIANNTNISLLPEMAALNADIKATLKRAFLTDDGGMYQLKMTLHKTGAAALAVRLEHVSMMYRLSLWAKVLEVSPLELRQLAEMCGLPDDLYRKTPEEWHALFEKMSATMQWLKKRGWTVADLMLMTRDVDKVPAGTDITNLLGSLKMAAVSAGLPDDADIDDYTLPLAPPLSAALNLPGETFSRTLLLWADKAKPGAVTLQQFWDILIKDAPTAEDVRASVAFSYALAQMALIVHATGITEEALALFMEAPDRLSNSAAQGDVLVRSADVVMSLAHFSDWLRTLNDQAGAGASVISSLAAGGVTPSLLAQVAGLSDIAVKQAAEEAKRYEDVEAADKLISWQETSIVLEWVLLAQAFGVMPSDIGRMLALNYQPDASAAAAWSDWKRVADAFIAGLTLAQQRAAEEGVTDRLSGALSAYLLATETLPLQGAGGREALFGYLLIDSLNGPQIRTSRLAEAITSLQVFIHRAQNLSPPADEYKGIVRETFDRQFFRDWVQWNSRYSTWSAGKKLMYYPENYIDPTMRLGQTQMMNDMLQVLGQAQINTDTVGDAFMGYLTGFEEVANLETISGYHDSADNEEGKTWFVGRNQMTPPEYWFRSVDEGKRAQGGEVPANAWTGWRKITVAAQPVGRMIRPVIYKERLYLGWVERVRHVIARDDNGKETAWEYRWELKVSWWRYDGGWSQPAIHAYPPAEVTKLEGLLSSLEGVDKLSLYLSAWPEKQLLIAGIYKQGAGSSDAATLFAGEVFVYEDMTFSPTDAASANWTTLKHMLDEGKISKVLQPFYPSPVMVENQLKNPSSLPGGFTRFDADDLKVRVIYETDDGASYRLQMGLTMTVDRERAETTSELLKHLVNAQPSLKTINRPCKVFNKLTDGSNDFTTGIVLIDEDSPGHFFAYMLTTFFMPQNTKICGDGLPGEAAQPFTTYPIEGKNLFTSRFEVLDDHAGMKYTLYYVSGPSTLGLNYFTGAPVIDDVVTPSLVGNPPGVIPKEQITSRIDNSFPYIALRDLDLSAGPAVYVWSSLYVYPPVLPFTFSGEEVQHTVTLKCGTDKSRTWTLRVYKATSDELAVDVIGSTETHGQVAQYLEHGGTRTRLNTLFARQLTERAASGIDAILNFDTQSLPEPPLNENDNGGVMDFSGANAIYFWELFYYTPMMVMQRFLQEERYDLAEKWLKYIFSPSGYIVRGVAESRIWNVRPLLEDTSWNDEPLISYDPDAVAQNDPMHYKLNAFMRLLDIIIGKGDAAYRKLERDTLAEAKVWYGRALCLLGEAPWIAPGEGWSNPTLGSVASDAVQHDRFDALSQMAQRIRRSEDIPLAAGAGSTTFLPEANGEMLRYWDILRMRLYNLRHNLTIDGQSMNLPLFAAPADPKALLSAAVAAEAGGANALPEFSGLPGIRFSPLLESARSMAGQLVQFGSTIQQVLERQDAEALSELLNTQGVEMSGISLSLQRRALEDIAAERKTLEQSLSNVSTRREHYYRLYQENTSPGEKRAIALTASAAETGLQSKALFTAAGAIAVAPTIFGLANGGMRPEGVPNAAGHIMTLMSEADSIKAQRIHQEEIFRRRREEWDIQYRMAEGEMNVIQAQLDALNVRETAINMQIEQAQLQQAQMQAQLALLQGKFTGKAMYSWMRGQLAVIFYQYYDLTVSRCLMAQKALQWEKGDNTLYLRAGTWNGAWAGLMCGEGLLLNLAQMDDAWTRWQRREKEITRTVSLAEFFSEKLAGQEPGTLQAAIGSLLDQGTGEVGEGDNKIMLTEGALGESVLGVSFSLADLKFENDGYGLPEKVRRIRSIAVSVPALLGPYQDLRATVTAATSALPPGCNQMALSHAMMDSGRFMAEGGDYRWLPFEGLKLTDETEGVISTPMSISFADALTDQKALLESLSDIILHIQYTLRD